MLKPAYEYKERIYELLKKLPYSSYTEFLNSGQTLQMPLINANNDNYYCWVSVDKQDNLVGYFAYYITDTTFYIPIAIGFLTNNFIFGCDWYQIILHHTLQHNITTIKWKSFMNNPSAPRYKRICDMFNGKITREGQLYCY